MIRIQRLKHRDLELVFVIDLISEQMIQCLILVLFDVPKCLCDVLKNRNTLRRVI